MMAVVALGVVPLLLLAGTAELRSKGTRQYSRLGEYYYRASIANSARALYTEHVFESRNDQISRDPVRGRASFMRTAFARGPRYFLGETVCDDTHFEYTIQWHNEAEPQLVADKGGFSEIALRLYDRLGNSFTIPRRISNN